MKVEDIIGDIDKIKMELGQTRYTLKKSQMNKTHTMRWNTQKNQEECCISWCRTRKYRGSRGRSISKGELQRSVREEDGKDDEEEEEEEEELTQI